jgi:beta-glucosidase/6-phospho-beta-glucosidase/beta-galactosidase
MSVLQLTSVYESGKFRIETDESQAYVRTEWLLPVSDDQFKAEALKAYEVIAKQKADKVLINAEQVSILGPETKDWLSNTYYSLFSDTRVRKMARVMPDNLFKKLALTSVITRANALSDLSYTIQDFASEDEAVRWLLEA